MQVNFQLQLLLFLGQISVDGPITRLLTNYPFMDQLPIYGPNYQFMDQLLVSFGQLLVSWPITTVSWTNYHQCLANYHCLQDNYQFFGQIPPIFGHLPVIQLSLGQLPFYKGYNPPLNSLKAVILLNVSRNNSVQTVYINYITQYISTSSQQSFRGKVTII